MIRLPSGLVITIASLFILSPVFTAAIGFVHNGVELLDAVALTLYLLAAFTSVLYYRELRMPRPLALVGLLISVFVPLLVNFTLDESDYGTVATWYVSGVSILMAICAVRQEKTIAWLGTAFLTVQVFIWGGANTLFDSGIAGAIALVATAHAISVEMGNSAKQTVSYLQTATLTQAAAAAEASIRQERSERLTKTLRGALPMLEKIAAGNISAADRIEAAILEAELRDEIRGRTLINTKLKSSVRQARSRGVEVVLLDEGGFDGVPEPERDDLRSRLADELDRIESGRVTIRSPREDSSRVTFVASRKGTARPDVFLKL